MNLIILKIICDSFNHNAIIFNFLKNSSAPIYDVDFMKLIV